MEAVSFLPLLLLLQRIFQFLSHTLLWLLRTLPVTDPSRSNEPKQRSFLILDHLLSLSAPISKEIPENQSKFNLPSKLKLSMI